MWTFTLECAEPTVKKEQYVLKPRGQKDVFQGLTAFGMTGMQGAWYRDVEGKIGLSDPIQIVT